jgi:hypothetical protein
LHILTTFTQLSQIQTLLHDILRPGSSSNSEAATITFTFVLIVVNSIVTLSKFDGIPVFIKPKMKQWSKKRDNDVEG